MSKPSKNQEKKLLTDDTAGDDNPPVHVDHAEYIARMEPPPDDDD